MTYDPSLRVLTVLELLQARESVTGAELARILEVSPRTVQRYVMRLQDLGMPVEGKRGVGGAYRLTPGFRLPPMMFTGEEALAVTLGLQALRQLGLDALAPAAEAASAKLTRTLPAALREDVRALENAVQMDSSPWVISTDTALLSKLLRAVRGSLVVELTYTSAQQAGTSRRVNVYRVVYLDGRWYAVGWCHLRQGLRSFRLDRISKISVLDEVFVPPETFDAVAYLRSSAPEVPQLHDVSVWLACPPYQLQGSVSVWHTEIVAEGKGTRIRCQRENLFSFAAFLLGLNCDFCIDGPPALREVFGTLKERCLVASDAAG